ncbi:MAG TPA: hypothetical protein VMB26_18130 [Candidatus Binataceae bacterium]|nr:hypothetical protein [Candidatus Binataceae bacterium]
MSIDRARVAAIVQAGLDRAGVRLDAGELAQLEALTATMLEGVYQLDELNISGQVEPALIFSVAKPQDDE